MKTIIIFIFVLILAFITFIVLSFMEQTFLGIVLAAIIITWPFVFWIISKVIGKRGKEKEEEKRFKQDIIDENPETPEISTEEPETEEEEFVVPPKKDVNVNKAREELEKLKKASEILDEEKNEGILSEEIYNEVKKQNKETIEKLEQEIAKAGGEIREKKVYCRKGKHYISLNVCLPSKIKGYVICPEHNEEIRVE